MKYLLCVICCLFSVCTFSQLVPIGYNENSIRTTFASNIQRVQYQINGGIHQVVYFTAFEEGEADIYLTWDNKSEYICNYCYYRFTGQNLFYKYVDYLNLHLNDNFIKHIDKKPQTNQGVMLSIFGYKVLTTIYAQTSPYKLYFFKQ